MLGTKTIGMIGVGKMGEAILAGMLQADGKLAERVLITATNQDKLAALSERYGVRYCVNDGENRGAIAVVQQSDIVLLAVKPQTARMLLASIGSEIAQKKPLIISVMGGITTEFLETFCGQSAVVRVMPNLPLLVKKGATGIAAGRYADEADVQIAQSIFDAMGVSCVVEEKLIDPITSVSGCGPAYGYMFIEALADGGVNMGLPRDTALLLAAQTLAGAAEMVLQTGKHPGALKDDVCSPGGSTIAGVQMLEQHAFRSAVIDAVQAARKKMEDVGKKA